MSRVGKLAVEIPSDVQVNITPTQATIKGKQGELHLPLPKLVKVTQEGQKVWVKPANDTIRSRAMWGTVRNLLKNMVEGVTKGFSVRLEIFGVGFRAQADNNFLTLSLGYSHDIKYAIPKDIKIKCEKPTLLVISGADRQKVGQVAGELIKLRKVEPYKGKGVFIEGSYIRRKEGKKK